MSQRTGVSAATAAVVFAAMWLGWLQNWSWLTAVDDWLLAGLYPVGAAHPAWVTCWNVFCTVLGPTAFRLLGVVLIIWLLVHRRLRPAFFLVLCIELAGLVTQAAKLLANRSRPPTAMVDAFGTSFPSGHAVGVTAAVFGLLTVVLPMVAPRWRGSLRLIGAVIIVLIGVGRVVLNVHHPSDVLAGWALGYLWFLVCLLALRPVDRISAAGETPATPDSGS